MSSRRVQGWDPILIICQIISLQSLHYLTLSLLLPPLLLTLTQPSFLAHQGGPSTVSVMMDWRELAGRPTFHPPASAKEHHSWMEMFGGAWAGGRKVTSEEEKEGGNRGAVSKGEGEEWVGGWDGRVDPKRGWVIAVGWGGACLVDVLYLYHLIRRPTHILDHTLTLFGIHLLLTTYFSSSFPTSLFFWLVLGTGALGVVVCAEQVCVGREMREGFGDWGGGGAGSEPGDEEEEEERLMRSGEMGGGREDGLGGGETIELSSMGGKGGARREEEV
ncbi:hypothetical protein BDY24DRAFT_384243 [Mrakia frigida]|uniref:uncharacterized protein n=1 Tax=Mrakia frigida TaxID=29902 RepID=UPI003FCBFD94